MFTKMLLKRFIVRLPVGRLLSTEAAVSKEEFRLDRLTGNETGIVLFRMNRPKAMNAISRNLLAGFYEAIENVRFDRKASVIIIKSDVPNAFCAGADLKERATMPPEMVPHFVGRARR